jgi:EF-P beta-lysylation protein EpmB
MIAVSNRAGQPRRWQKALREAITDPAELVEVLGLDPALVEPARRAAERFPLRVPRGFVARMRRGDPHDPLLRQVLPLDAELVEHPGFVPDPVGDLPSAAGPGLLHKYAGRALLIATGACAVHCRYCFRREFPYAEQLAGASRFEAALELIRRDVSLEEVILSGGDPLSLSNSRLAELSATLDAVPHLRRLRLHTRHPVVLPERVDSGLLDWLSSTRLPVAMVVHANHPAEIDATVAAALRSVADRGVTLLNQSVLLKGVNDSADTLQELAERLFDARVLPYYLHLLDRVRGAAHFEVCEEEALKILEALRARLPGYLTPRLVREEAGQHSKTPVAQ